MFHKYLVWLQIVNNKTQNLYFHYLKVFLEFLTKCRVTPNWISNVRLLFGVIGILLFVNWYRYNWAANFLFVAILLGFLNSVLYKYQNNSKDHDLFLNIFVGYILYAFLLVLTSLVANSRMVVGYNLFIIPVFCLLFIIKKQELASSNWLVKSLPTVFYIQIPVLVAFFVHQYLDLDLDWLDWALDFSNIVATVLSVYYFLYIQLRWKKLG